MSEALPQPSVFDAEPLRPDHSHIWGALAELNGKVGGLVETVGKPGSPDGSAAPTGVFAHIHDNTKRISRFEKLWDRGMGFALALVTVAPLVWFLAGEKIAKVFQG